MRILIKSAVTCKTTVWRVPAKETNQLMNTEMRSTRILADVSRMDKVTSDTVKKSHKLQNRKGCAGTDGHSERQTAKNFRAVGTCSKRKERTPKENHALNRSGNEVVWRMDREERSRHKRMKHILP